jgi:hypothetical protein
MLSEKFDFKAQILLKISNLENSYLRSERNYRVETFTKISDKTRFMKHLNLKVKKCILEQ